MTKHRRKYTGKNLSNSVNSSKSSKPSLKEKALEGIFWSFVQQWGSQLFSTLVFLVLARLLGAEAFGLVALASVFLAFMQIFLDQGFAQAIIQRKDLESEHLDTAFWTSFGMGAFLTLLTMLFAPQLAILFKEPKLTSVLQVLSISFLINGLNSVQTALFQRNLNFKNLAFRQLTSTFVGGSIGLIMAFLNFGVWSLVARQIVDVSVGVVLIWSMSDWRPRLRFSRKHFSELFSFGLNVIGINLMNFLTRRSDDFLIGYFLGAVALGYYSVAYKLLLLMTDLLIGTIQKTAMPIFSRLQEDPERLKRAFYNAIQLTSLIAFPVYLGMLILAPELIHIIFGEQWEKSIPVMQVLALLGPIFAGFYYNDPILMALGKPRLNLLMNSMQGLGNLLFFFLAVRWGIVAVAGAYVLRVYLISPITLLIVHRLVKIDFRDYFKQYATPLFSSIVMILALLFAKYLLADAVDVRVALPLYIMLGAAAYVTTVKLTNPGLTDQTLALVRSRFSKSTSP